jgi:hypothetical protein
MAFDEQTTPVAPSTNGTGSKPARQFVRRGAAERQS